MKKFILTLNVFSVLTVYQAYGETVKSVTQISYDAVGRKDCIATRMNESSFLSLPTDACTLGTEGTEGRDRITKSVYDAAGQLRQVIQAYGTVNQRAYSTFNYSLSGKVTDSIDANGNRTRNEYDIFERLKKIYYPVKTPPLGYSPSTPSSAIASAGEWNPNDFEEFDYDINGNKVFFRRRNGHEINYVYDNLNQLLIENLPSSPGNINGTDKDIYYSYRYDGLLQKKRFVEFNGVGVTYTYDGIGRMTSTTDSFGRQLIFGYTVTGAPRTKLFYPDGKAWTQFYDATRLSTSMVDSEDQTVFEVNYTTAGKRASLLRNSGPSTSYEHDERNRLTFLTHDFNGSQDDIRFGFSYNPSNQINFTSSSTNLYDYVDYENSQNRIYDGLNRDSTIADGGGYDENGNLTKDAARFMIYDVHNNLVSVAASPTAIPYMTLDYDPEGRLLKTVVNNVTTTFLYDGINLIAEYDESGNMIRRYVHGPGVDEPLIWYEGSDILDRRYFIQNYQGSVIATTDHAGNRSHLYKYGSFGEPKDANNNDNWSGSRFRYTGQIILGDAELYYYKARVYDPKYGRFLQTDPIGTADNTNLYAYVGNDPINKIDPTGKNGVIPDLGQMRAYAQSSQVTPQSMRAAIFAEEHKTKMALATLGDGADLAALGAIKMGRGDVAIGFGVVATAASIAENSVDFTSGLDSTMKSNEATLAEGTGAAAGKATENAVQALGEVAGTMGMKGKAMEKVVDITAEAASQKVSEAVTKDYLNP